MGKSGWVGIDTIGSRLEGQSADAGTAMAEGGGERDWALKRISAVSGTASRGCVVSVSGVVAVVVDAGGKGRCCCCYAAIGTTAGLSAETHCEWRTDLGDVGMLNGERAQVTTGVGTTAIIATAVEGLLTIRLVVVVGLGVGVSVCCSC